MKGFAASLILAAIAAVQAAPLEKRDPPTSYNSVNDYVILQYALTLEHLEDTFYKQGLANYSASDFSSAGYGDSVRENIVKVGGDESEHVSFLTTALQSLNQTPVEACEYSFGATSPSSFLATAAILESVGVSAYLGAAASIASKTYLTAAGAILTVEARHASYINSILPSGQSPFPEPFDTPLDFNEVYSLASLFITSCPSSNPTLPVKAFPGLTATTSNATAGGMVTLTPANMTSVSGTSPIYAAFIGYPTNEYGLWDPTSMTVQIPTTANGLQYIVLSSSNMNVSDETILAGPAVITIA